MPVVFHPRLVAFLSLGCLVLSSSAYAQFGGRSSPLTNAEIPNSADRLTLLVSVRETSGIPLSVGAIVHLSPVTGGQSATANTTDAATATFPGIRAGEYEVKAEAAGYETATERTFVAGLSTSTIYVYLAPAGSGGAVHKAPTDTVMTPDLQREMDKGLIAARQKNFPEARKHFQKAHKMAPSNPDILYLLGMIDYTTRDIPSARKQFESVVASYPSHHRSLLVLGQIQLDSGETQAAVETLQKAVESSPVDWQSHYLLAMADARTGSFEKARMESDRALELNKEKRPAIKLLQAKLYLMQRRNADAREAFEAYLREFPSEPGSEEAKQYLVKIEEASKREALLSPYEASAATVPQPSVSESDSVGRAAVAFEKPWAPPDVDAGVPPTAPSVSCALNEVLQKAQRRILSQLADLENFGATEVIEHQLVDPYGVPSAPASQQFDYLIFVHHTETLPYYFDEVRNGAESLDSFPTKLATRGLVSLGFMIIHPVFSQDFQFSCEGLGTWKGQPAWQIHFAQRRDVPPRIRTWSYKKVLYPVALKGRIWVEANTGNLLHLESTLREPIPQLRLNREQLMVDYGPVRFDSHHTELWLPWYADMYFEWQGRRYHHRHTLTNYVLFDVDTRNKIAAPPQPAEIKEP